MPWAQPTERLSKSDLSLKITQFFLLYVIKQVPKRAQKNDNASLSSIMLISIEVKTGPSRKTEESKNGRKLETRTKNIFVK